MEYEKQIMIMDAGHNPCRVTAPQWQHTLAQRQRFGKRKTKWLVSKPGGFA
jgi:hypothetical protein